MELPLFFTAFHTEGVDRELLLLRGMWKRAVGLVCIVVLAGVVMTGNAEALTRLAGASTVLSDSPAVPEPGAALLVGIGLTLVARSLRKRSDTHSG